MQNYRVRVKDIDPLYDRFSAQDFELPLDAKRADPTAGFNPVETLLPSLGDCLLTVPDHVAELSKRSINRAWVELEAARQDNPPALTQIHYTLHLTSEAPRELLDRLVGLAERNTTVFQTLSQALPIEGSWEIST